MIFKEPIKEKQKYKYIVIDTNNAFLRIFDKNINKEPIDDLFDKIISKPIQNFLSNIESILKEYSFEDTEVYFLFDNPNSVYHKRREIDEAYKHKRERNLITSFSIKLLNIARQILERYSNRYYTIKIQGYEADDIVLPLINYLPIDAFKKCLLISNDMDWSRSLSENVHWYNYYTLFDPIGFNKKYGFYPTQNKIILYKTIHGDNSDNIENAVPNLPVELLIHIVNKYQTYEDLLLHIDMDDTIPKHWKDKINGAENRMKINEQLVSFLPFDSNLIDYIRKGKEVKGSLDVLLKSLGIQNKYSKKVEDDLFYKKIKLR